MAAETTSTSLTELVNSEVIQPLVMDYAIDAMVATPLCRFVDLSAGKSKVAAFPIWVKDAGADLNEAASLANTELETTETTITAAQVGILREIQKMASKVSIVGGAELENFIARDAGMLLAEMVEDDVCGLFPSLTTSVGTTNTDLTLAVCAEAIGQRRTLKARGTGVFVFDDRAMLNVTTAVIAATGTVFAGGAQQSVLNSDSTGVAGMLLGTECRYTNLTDTANAGVDVVSALLNTGVPEATLGFVLLWAPEIDMEINAAKASKLYGITMAYGVGIINDLTGVKIISNAAP
jgi:hypothetical protein